MLKRRLFHIQIQIRMSGEESIASDLDEGYVPIYVTHVQLKIKKDGENGIEKYKKDAVFKIFVKQDDDVLNSVRLQLSDDQRLDFLYEADYGSEEFERLREEQQLEIEFDDFPNVIRKLMTTIIQQGDDTLNEGDYKIAFKDTDSDGICLIISQKIDICTVEIFRLEFIQITGERVQKIAQSRFDDISKKLKAIEIEYKDTIKRIERQAPKLIHNYQRQIPQ